ncbi:MAG: MFS transporter [Candidatus Lokiarchaeota archaeon]|nr:MFS transporter [Candidatus Lokiarchaeota archaeon]MBD3200586.1 MFS transporter [Candidatus Lokiarchaeota archaeon]
MFNMSEEPIKVEALAKKKEKEKIEVTPRSSKYQWYIVVFMGLVGLMDNNLNLMEAVAIVGIRDQYGLSPGEFAFWQGIFGIITFLVFFVAWFSDAFGRKKGVLFLMLLMGIPAFLMPFLAPFSVWIFWILYAIIITGTLSNMWEIPVAEEADPKKRGLLGGIATLISLIPVYAIFGEDIEEAFGWEWTYGIFFFFMLGLMVLWFFMKEPERWSKTHEERGFQKLKIREALKKITKTDAIYIIISTIVYGIWAIAFKFGTSWGETYYVEVNTAFASNWKTILLIGGLLILVGALISGILMDKVSRKATLILGCLGSITGFILMGLWGHPIAFWMLYLFMPVVFTWIMVYFAEVYRTEIRSTATGIAATGARASYVLGPLLAFALFEISPDMVIFWIVPGFLMIIPLLCLLLKPYETKGQTLEDIEIEREKR